MNKFSSSFIKSWFLFLEEYFQKNGSNWNWEPVMNSFISFKITKEPVFYVQSNMKWVNINYPSCYVRAKSFFEYNPQQSIL